MYPPSLAVTLREVDIEAITVGESGLAGRPDADVFEAATAGGSVLLTENVGDFARIAADHLGAGRHHHGVLVALSSRFSRRPSGRAPLVVAVTLAIGEPLEDRTVYLPRPEASE